MTTVRSQKIGRKGDGTAYERMKYILSKRIAQGRPRHSKKPRFLLEARRCIGGDKRNRTADLLNAIQALSQAMRQRTPETEAWEMRSIRGMQMNDAAFVRAGIFCMDLGQGWAGVSFHSHRKPKGSRGTFPASMASPVTRSV